MCSWKQLTKEHATEIKAGEEERGRAGMRVRENIHDSESICTCFQLNSHPPQEQETTNSLFLVKVHLE